MKEVCFDIKMEPDMLPVGMDNMIGNIADNARLDISARGRSQERTFFDVRVKHLNAASHLKNRGKLYTERVKKRKESIQRQSDEHRDGSIYTFGNLSAHG